MTAYLRGKKQLRVGDYSVSFQNGKWGKKKKTMITLIFYMIITPGDGDYNKYLALQNLIADLVLISPTVISEKYQNTQMHHKSPVIQNRCIT